MVGCVAGVELQAELHDGHGVALGDDQAHAVAERRLLQRRERRLGERLRHRQLRAVGNGVAGCQVRRERMHLDDERLALDPLARDAEHLLLRRAVQELERVLVEVGPAAVHGVLGEDVGLAAEAADLLDAANEAAAHLGLDAIELGSRRPFGEEARELLVERLLYGFEVLTFARGRIDDVRAGDLVDHRERAGVGRDLVLVNEPLIEPRRFAAREDVIGELQSTSIRR